MYIEKAYEGRNETWRYLVTMVLVIVVFFVGHIPVFAYLFSAGPNISEAALSKLDFRALGLDPNIGLALTLLPFALGFAALLGAIVVIHQRSVKSALTARGRFDWGRFFMAAGLWLALTACMELVMYGLNPDNYVFQLNWEGFLPLLAVSLIMLPLQTSFEELLMRGYLMQGLGIWVKFRWSPLLITSLLFGWMHGMNPEVEEFGFGLMMVYYVGVGLVLGICTLMDDGLELAFGFHAINNIYSATLVTFEGSALQTDALFRLKSLDPLLMLGGWALTAVIFLLLLSRKYQWGSWNKLLAQIEEPPPAENLAAEAAGETRP